MMRAERGARPAARAPRLAAPARSSGTLCDSVPLPPTCSQCRLQHRSRTKCGTSARLRPSAAPSQRGSVPARLRPRAAPSPRGSVPARLRPSAALSPRGPEPPLLETRPRPPPAQRGSSPSLRGLRAIPLAAPRFARSTPVRRRADVPDECAGAALAKGVPRPRARMTLCKRMRAATTRGRGVPAERGARAGPARTPASECCARAFVRHVGGLRPSPPPRARAARQRGSVAAPPSRSRRRAPSLRRPRLEVPSLRRSRTAIPVSQSPEVARAAPAIRAARIPQLLPTQPDLTSPVRTRTSPRRRAGRMRGRSARQGGATPLVLA